jgi:hypothetical protein
MKNLNQLSKNILSKIKQSDNQNGTATVIAVLILSLMTGFVALSITRSNNETMAISNDIAEAKVFTAAQAGLENMTLNADAKFDDKLDLDTADIDEIKAALPDNFPGIDFNQTLLKVRDSEIIDATGGTFQGLKQLRDEWQLSVTATDQQTGVQSILRRRFFNNRIPIFQFGVFADDDVDFSQAPRFDFGGRVHSNGNLFMSSGASNGLYFDSTITVHGEIVTDILPNGKAPNGNDNVWIKNAQLTPVNLKGNEGSALSAGTGANVFADTSYFPNSATLPVVHANSSWNTVKAKFDNKLLNRVDKLNLPLGSSLNNDKYIPIIKRGKAVGDVANNAAGTVANPSIVAVTPITQPITPATEDDVKTRKERFYNKVGLRISLADSRIKLPGCSSNAAGCGVRLDGNSDGSGAEPGVGEARGYQPLPMRDGTVNTRINGERIYIPNQESWIKVELVAAAANSTIVTTDVTKDILSLGVTERAEPDGNYFAITSGYTNNTDKYSIIKLQRFSIPGNQIRMSNNAGDSPYLTYFPNPNPLKPSLNFVLAQESLPGVLTIDKNPQSAWAGLTARFACSVTDATTCTADDTAHFKTATVNGIPNRKIVPFPIMMFDPREGISYETTTTTSPLYYNTLYPNGKTSLNGVMSSVDIDVANLRDFLNDPSENTPRTATAGTTYSAAKGALKGSAVPQANGWVVYLSDRRGDFDFDGEYDMEDIFATSTGVLNTGLLLAPGPGEDVNWNGTLQSEYVREAPFYSESIAPEVAATVNTRFYRRAVRLINGKLLPGIYDVNTPANTKGFTFASENGVYIVGNYNATGLTAFGSANTPTKSDYYIPQGDENHIPASIVADSTTVLSNNWKDANIFASPYNPATRVPTETTYRFAAITGDSLNFAPCNADFTNSGSSYPCYTGGVHNLNRFMEAWTGVRLNYTGSIINLYNSHNNNGAFKCCSQVYTAPNRNFAFDSSFLNPQRIPPGTPFVQTIKLTGFERVND